MQPNTTGEGIKQQKKSCWTKQFLRLLFKSVWITWIICTTHFLKCAQIRVSKQADKAFVFGCEWRETCSDELPIAYETTNTSHALNADNQANEEQASACSTLFLVMKNIRFAQSIAFNWVPRKENVKGAHPKWVRRFCHMNRKHFLLFDGKHLQNVCLRWLFASLSVHNCNTTQSNEVIARTFVISLHASAVIQQSAERCVRWDDSSLENRRMLDA